MGYRIYIYILIMAVVTYLIRMLPIVFIKREIKNRFLRSFLYYVPFVCLAAMAFPSILTSTSSLISGCVGFAVALFLAFRNKDIIIVALASCAAVFVTERVLVLIGLL